MRDFTELYDQQRHWIDNEWRPSKGKSRFSVIDPSSEEVVGIVAGGNAEDIADAVAAAQRALATWSVTSLEERIELLERLCEVIDSDATCLADIITTEVGAPIAIARSAHVGLVSDILRSFVVTARQFVFEEKVGQSLLVHEPVGVVGCITPWNLPLILIAQKIGAAIVTGCTVVLKPSEVTPINALRLAECTHEAGLPPGVFNVVTGDGASAGEALVSHPDVRKVSFTGSTRAGKRVAMLATETVKRVGLELGGKSANIVLRDGDLSQAIAGGVRQATFNTGQSCIAWSRILVHQSQMNDATHLAVEEMSKLCVGDPRDPGTDLGPVVSELAANRVRGYIRRGMEEGAHLAVGGLAHPAGLDRGYYVSPTLFTGVSPRMVIAREEIFGPVVSIIPYETESEAVLIANDSEYGLHGAVWSHDEDHALLVARQLATGMVNINGYGFDAMAPFGGYKQSGLGRELGAAGVSEFLQIKAIQAFAGT